MTHTNAAGQRGTAGSNKVEIAALGAALSKRFDASTYLEAAALVSYLRATSASVRGLGFKTSGTGLAAAVEAGQRLNLSASWGWQPHATLRLAQTSLGTTRDDAGQVRLGDARSAQIGLGATLQTTGDSATQFSATARLLHELAGRPGTVLADTKGGNGQTFHSSTRGTTLQLKAGVEHRVGQGTRLFASLNHTQGLKAGNKGSSDTGATVGAKINW
ncbi:MAG: autotransporter outer membrane beta-barrel domain-containing protein [Hydrogenophaga sp.]|nr:autotransporter outer membrane beta-barrel domain-containing protein [Hydrogenophaga sp.]